MKNVSDQHGRAFEYIIAQTMALKCGAMLTEQAKTAQQRDQIKFYQLPEDLSQRFQLAAIRLVSVLQASGKSIAACILDRIQDSAAEAGDVTDIRLTLSSGEIINLSIKNNHHALKHQRPPSLMQQLGFSKGSDEDLNYRAELSAIYSCFYRKAYEALPGAVNFRDIENTSSGFIAKNLYRPVCRYVSNILSQYLVYETYCQNFFTFLVGNTDYKKIILNEKFLEITDFYAVSCTKNCKVLYTDASPSYIFLSFDNQWKLSLRLHTAASALGSTPSLKFDTQAMHAPIPPSTIFSL